MSTIGKAAPLLLVALIAAGGVNYRRNAYLDTELDNNRPYKSLSSGDLEALIEAHRGEKLRIEQRLGQLSQGTDPMDRYAPSDLTGKLSGFEKVQRKAVREREVRGEALDHQVAIESIQREQQIRAQGLDRKWTRILRRVTTL